MKEGVQLAHTPPESQFTVETRQTRQNTKAPSAPPDSTPPKKVSSWPKDRVSVVIPKAPAPAKVTFTEPEVTKEIPPVDQELLDEVLAMEEPSPVPQPKADSTLPDSNKQKNHTLQPKAKSFQRRSLAEELLHKNPSWREAWKYLLPEALLATNPPWQQSISDFIRKRNTPVSVLKTEVVTDSVQEHFEPELYSVNFQEKGDLPVGGIVVHDAVEQFVNLSGGHYTGPFQMTTGNMAPENADLRTFWPMINKHGKKESLVDGGSQIASISLKAALELGIAYDPTFMITMESADKGRTSTLGLARNIPFDFEGIVYYLQLHVLQDPAYEVLLGRPFEIVSNLVITNLPNGNAIGTLTDNTNGRKLSLPSYRRGQIPRHMIPGGQQGFHLNPRT